MLFALLLLTFSRTTTPPPHRGDKQPFGHPLSRDENKFRECLLWWKKVQSAQKKVNAQKNMDLPLLRFLLLQYRSVLDALVLISEYIEDAADLRSEIQSALTFVHDTWLIENEHKGKKGACAVCCVTNPDTVRLFVHGLNMFKEKGYSKMLHLLHNVRLAGILGISPPLIAVYPYIQGDEDIRMFWDMKYGGVTLLEFIRNKRLALHESISICLQIVTLVNRIHTKMGRVHCDLHYGNILVDNSSLSPKCFVIDFDGAVKVETKIPKDLCPNVPPDMDKRTFLYMFSHIAPEQLDENPVATVSIDTYALGNVIKCLIGVENMPVWKGTPLNVAMREEDPSQRPSLAEVIKLLEMMQFSLS
jgi:hypothetical protein